MNIHRFIIVLAVASVSVCIGQNKKQNTKNHAIQSDTLKIKETQLLAVPLVFYTPETGFAFGGGGQLFFKTKNSTSKGLNSNIFASAIYTLNKQIMVEIQPQVYFSNEKYFLDASIRYMVFPDLFWGIGPDTQDSAEENYNQTELSFSAAFIKRLPRNVNFGFEFNFSDYKMTEVEEGGLLASGAVEGGSGATLAGLGVVLNLDNRDNKFSPLRGEFLQFKTNFTTKVLGSTHTFNTYQIDLRKYVPLRKNHVLALQLYSQLTFGDSPFQAKAYYGGRGGPRGFYGGRYIDDNLYVAQMEYRIPVFKRWEFAAFVSTGNVGNEERSLFNDFKTSFGLGPRYFIYKNKRTLLRLDIAINNEGNSGIYFGINEAF